jgi:hypothetical protein
MYNGSKTKMADESIPSLRKLALKSLSSKIRILERVDPSLIQDAGYMGLDLWLEIIRNTSRDRLNPELMCRIESIFPHLECEEVDDLAWKNIVQQRFPLRRLPSSFVEPYPVVHLKVKCAVDRLLSWLESTKTPGKLEQAVYDDILVLEAAVPSVQLMKDTGIGHLLKSLRRFSSLEATVLERLSVLHQKLKEYYAAYREAALKNEPMTQASSSTRRLTTVNSMPKKVILPFRATPLEHEDGLAQCSSWKKLLYYLKKKQDEDTERF